MNFNFKKQFGQNFLVDKNIINKIVSAFDFFQEIYEIGPGNGALTKEFLNKGKKVTAIDIDIECIQALKELQSSNLNLLHQDVLHFKFPYAPVVGNLPYNIASRIIKNFVISPIPYGVFMVQKEVADRILGNTVSKITHFVHSTYSVEKLCSVKPSSFVPSPKVVSCVIILKKNDLFNVNLKNLEYILNAFFKFRRKKISHLKKHELSLFNLIEKNGWDLNLRAEDVKCEDYFKLSHAVKSF